MKFIYIGRCAAGCVVFRRNDEVVTMHIGDPVEVPDWLAGKLVNNNNFDRVESAPALFAEDSVHKDHMDEQLDTRAEESSNLLALTEEEPVRRGPGRPRKSL